MANRNNTRRVARSAGFTLVEIMLAAMILGVGLLMLLPAFTLGIVESSQMVDASLAAQTVQTGEAICLTTLMNTDPNWWTSINTVTNNDGNLHVYSFQTPYSSKANIADDANLRVQGDPVLSNYYWSLLFLVRQTNGPAVPPVMVDLWVMACKRDTTGSGNPTPGAQAIQLASVSGSAGSITLSGAPAALQVADSYVVANTGEVLHITGVNGSTLTVTPAVTTAFSSVWYVLSTSTNKNACLYVAYTKKAF